MNNIYNESNFFSCDFSRLIKEKIVAKNLKMAEDQERVAVEDGKKVRTQKKKTLMLTLMPRKLLRPLLELKKRITTTSPAAPEPNHSLAVQNPAPIPALILLNGQQ